MSAATCPSREELFDYVVGRLSDEASDGVAEHLESCRSCQAGLATFDDADDTLVAQLRLPTENDPYAAESQCQVALARARAVAGQPDSGAGVSADPASTDARLLGTLGEYRLLAKEPDERFATPEEVAEALEPFCIACDLPGLLVRAEAATPEGLPGYPLGAALLRDGSSRAPQSRPTPLPFWRRGKLLAAAVGLMLLSVGAGIALGIIITIYRDGKATTIGVEDGSNVNVDRHGNVGVTPPGENGKPVPPAAKSDIEAIQGTWQVVSSSFNLFPMVGWLEGVTKDEVIRTTKVVITPDAFKFLGEHIVDVAYEYQLDPNSRPGIIDLKAGSRIALGVYELAGDQLKVCAVPVFRFPGEKPERPTALWAEYGSGKELLVLKRIGAAVVDPDETAIQGEWEVVRCEGQLSHQELTYCFGDELRHRKVRITRHGLAIKGLTYEKSKSSGPRDPLRGTTSWQPAYALDPTEAPKTIDLVYYGSEWLGIYELRGSQLTICFGKQRPNSHEAKLGEDQVLIVMERVRDAQSSDDQSAVGIGRDGDVRILTPGESKAPGATADAEAIRGTWKGLAQSTEESSNGQKGTSSLPVRLVVTESGLSYYRDDKLARAFEYTIDPTKKPRQIDFLLDGETVAQGSYEIDGDRLRVMWRHMEDGGERPKSFFLPACANCRLFDVYRDTGAESAAAPTGDDALAVYLDTDGRVSVGGRSCDPASLQEMLRKRVQEDPRMRVRLIAASETPHRHVVAILDMVKAVGVADVSIAVGEPLAHARLDFRIAPTRDGKGGPAVDEAEIRRYVDELKAHGPNFGEALRGAIKDGGPFESERQRQQRVKTAIQEELALIISHMSGVESASVLYDTQKQGGLNRQTVTTASVAVKPLGSEELDDSQVWAIRQVVAGAIAGLKPEDVTVADLTGAIHHGGQTDDAGAPEDPYTSLKRTYERQFKAKILNALAYVPGVKVAVHAALDREAVGESEKPDAGPKERAGLAPKQVRVSVSVPLSYTEKVWQERNPPGPDEAWKTPDQAALDALQKEEATKIRKHIAALLPQTGGVEDPTELVSVAVAGGQRPDAYAWFEVEGTAGAELITATCRGRTYVLLATTPGDVILAEEDGKRTWGLEAVHLERDPQGQPAVGVDFDEAGQKRFAALTGSHLEQRLAVLLNDRVVCAPTIKTKLSRRALILGQFDDEDVRQMVRALQAGMITRSAGNPSMQPQKRDERAGPETPRATGEPTKADGPD